jgi:elongator complex protein 3
MALPEALSEILAALTAELVFSNTLSPAFIRKTCNNAAQRHHSPVPKLTELLAASSPRDRALLIPFLRAKPVRTASGVAVVAVMCRPHRCPHQSTSGTTCTYCPGGVDSDFSFSSQSYSGYEPTSMRAIRARYDPYAQVQRRLAELASLGHGTNKVEIIVMGGTFLCLPQPYREHFIASIFDSLSGHDSASVADAVAYGEHAGTRCVGLTIETRPDFCLPPHIRDMLQYGTTRLEIGVQTVYDDVMAAINRGHTIRSVHRCFWDLKRSGFKVTAHMMPNLPDVDLERDLWGFRELFENPAFRPDGLKLYPLLVIRGTGVYEQWRQGRHQAYALADLVTLTSRVLLAAPPWLRVYRVQRDIPLPIVSAGADTGSLRQIAQKRAAQAGRPVFEIRAREAGLVESASPLPPKLELVRRDYWASGGWETFLALEDPTDGRHTLAGLLRLRRGEPNPVVPELRHASLVREVHVYGVALSVSRRHIGGTGTQHRGIGALLVRAAERIARTEHRASRLAIISGVGVRDYYRHLGYRRAGTFMVRELRQKKR